MTDAAVDGPIPNACRELLRAMDGFDEQAGAALGVGRSDLRALNLLEHGPLTATGLADRLGLTRPAVTALVDRLVDAGYVRRTTVPGDRRAAAIELRPATWRAFARVYRPLGERVHEAVAHLSAEQQAAVVDAMSAIVAAFDDARRRMRDG